MQVQVNIERNLGMIAERIGEQSASDASSVTNFSNILNNISDATRNIQASGNRIDTQNKINRSTSSNRKNVERQESNNIRDNAKKESISKNKADDSTRTSEKSGKQSSSKNDRNINNESQHIKTSNNKKSVKEKNDSDSTSTALSKNNEEVDYAKIKSMDDSVKRDPMISSNLPLDTELDDVTTDEGILLSAVNSSTEIAEDYIDEIEDKPLVVQDNINDEQADSEFVTLLSESRNVKPSVSVLPLENEKSSINTETNEILEKDLNKDEVVAKDYLSDISDINVAKEQKQKSELVTFSENTNIDENMKADARVLTDTTSVDENFETENISVEGKLKADNTGVDENLKADLKNISEKVSQTIETDPNTKTVKTDSTVQEIQNESSENVNVRTTVISETENSDFKDSELEDVSLIKMNSESLTRSESLTENDKQVKISSIQSKEENQSLVQKSIEDKVDINEIQNETQNVEVRRESDLRVPVMSSAEQTVKSETVVSVTSADRILKAAMNIEGNETIEKDISDAIVSDETDTDSAIDFDKIDLGQKSFAETLKQIRLAELQSSRHTESVRPINIHQSVADMINISMNHSSAGVSQNDFSSIRTTGTTAISNMENVSSVNESSNITVTVNDKNLQTDMKNQEFQELQKPVHMSRNYEENARQMAERINMMISRNMKEAELNLDPVGLGKMKISVQISEDGIAKVNMVVQQSETKDLVYESMNRLRDFMEQKGLSLGESSVEQQNSWADKSQNGETSQKGGFSSDTIASEDSLESVVSAEVRVSDSAVDYFA